MSSKGTWADVAIGMLGALGLIGWAARGLGRHTESPPSPEPPTASLAPWVCGTCLRWFDPTDAEIPNVCPPCRDKEITAYHRGLQ